MTKWIAASALTTDPSGYVPGRTAKKDLRESGRRRGSSTVSARYADWPVTVGGVAEGVRRASRYRMIGGSHVSALRQLVMVSGP